MEQKKYQVYTLKNFDKLPQINYALSEEEIYAMKVIGNVLPFKVNNYVVEELIDWDNIPEDPIFQLTFPQRGMLSDEHFYMMKTALDRDGSRAEIQEAANKIRLELNPHPAGQSDNVPTLNDGTKLPGIQHKYRETLLFFPSNSQTCHAYCTFCFRWPQFVGIDELKFAMKETDLLVQYLNENPDVTDVLFTGGDPMIMKAKKFESYIDPLINSDSNLKTIRIGTKALGYWPYRFTTDSDADDMLRVFERVVKKGYHLAFMAHFNHSVELSTPEVKEAIRRIRDTGAEIRTQSPIMNHINNDADEWANMWREQASLGCIPYYMFVARDTGAQDYFAVSLDQAWNVYRKAYRQVSGIARTVRGPSMSANPGKVHVVGVSEIDGEKAFVLNFIQGRDPQWVNRPFFAKYDPDAIWLDELEPFEDKDKFFFEEEMERTRLVMN